MNTPISAARLTFALLAPCALLTANGQPRPFMEIYSDVRPAGGTWGSTTVVQPGDRVEIQVRVKLLNPPFNIEGFGGMTYQPTLSGWQPSLGDRAINFENPCPGGCPDPLFYGRIAPFTFSGMTTSSPSGPLTAFADPGNVLRIAGRNNITATTDRAWGIASSQVTPEFGGTRFNPSLDVVVFRYYVDLSPQLPNRTLQAAVPLEYINLRFASWYLNSPAPEDLYINVTNSGVFFSGTITVVPAPSGAAALAALGCLALRRRRV